ncbi:myosin-11-like [Mugil cephalus]|uniref:myosin-11-like n=1 Tax=Mugil cephalus TaxID=48193 RepID=UPI001FB74B3D|nr:myosin-11-like [Mugil cephalus]
MDKKSKSMEDKTAPDKEKSLYLTQIRHLDEQLERCQRKSDELRKQNKDLVSQHRALEVDKRDISEYLVHSVPAEQRKVDKLVELLEHQRHVHQQEREDLELQHGQKRQQLQEHIHKLTSESEAHVAKMQEIKEQQKQLRQQLLDMESREEQMETQRKEQRAAIKSLELDLTQKRQRAVQECSEVIDGRIKATVSAIVEEERAQHRDMFEKVQPLLQENVELMEEKHILKRQQFELSVKAGETRTKNNKAVLDISNLTKEEEKLMKRKQKNKVKLGKSRLEDDIRQRLASLSEDRRRIMSAAAELEAELQKERSRRRPLERDVKEAVSVLRDVVTSSDKVSEVQSKTRKLLQILDRDEPTSGPDAASQAETQDLDQELDLDLDPLVLMARCRSGDLGLVPGPSWSRPSGAHQFTGLHWLLKRKRFEYWLSTCINASDAASQQTDAEAAAASSSSSSDASTEV